MRLRDAQGKNFATRLGNVFVIGNGETPDVKLPKEQGIYRTALEEFRDAQEQEGAEEEAWSGKIRWSIYTVLMYVTGV